MAGKIQYLVNKDLSSTWNNSLVQAQALVDIAHSLSRILEELVKMNNHPFVTVKVVDDDPNT